MLFYSEEFNLYFNIFIEMQLNFVTALNKIKLGGRVAFIV